MYAAKHAVLEVAQLVLLQRPSGGILMLEDCDGRWGLPGGRLNEGETWLEGLQREVREETGIEHFTLSQPLGVYQRISRSSGLSVYGVIFGGTTSESTVTLSYEHQSFQWFVSLDDCDNKTFFPREVEPLVRAALRSA